MNDLEIEILRMDMVGSFYEYANLNSGDLQRRMAAWDSYCKKRELFLEADAHRRGIKYRNLKSTLIDTNGSQIYKKHPTEGEFEC